MENGSADRRALFTDWCREDSPAPQTAVRTLFRRYHLRRPALRNDSVFFLVGEI
jgi:hypothetical protein